MSCLETDCHNHIPYPLGV